MTQPYQCMHSIIVINIYSKLFTFLWYFSFCVKNNIYLNKWHATFVLLITVIFITVFFVKGIVIHDNCIHHDNWIQKPRHCWVTKTVLYYSSKHLSHCGYLTRPLHRFRKKEKIMDYRFLGRRQIMLGWQFKRTNGAMYIVLLFLHHKTNMGTLSGALTHCAIINVYEFYLLCDKM